MMHFRFSFVLKFFPGALAILLLIGGASATVTEKTYSFNGTDGSGSMAPVILDGAGNLYGTTSSGGGSSACTGGCGMVFELTLGANGGVTENVLHAFTGGDDGAWPYAGLIFDKAGNLYGTTAGGGNTACTGGCGVAFELTPGANGQWTEKVLYSFKPRPDGNSPLSGLIFDSKGNLYGTTVYGGSHNYGTVFELSPGANGQWTETVLHAFKDGKDGGYPSAGVIFDSAGNLYGATTVGGGSGNLCQGGCGVVFELSPGANGQWSGTVVHKFEFNDGASPWGGLIFDSAGNLYGTTEEGGYIGSNGTVFELTPGANGQWTEKVLYKFNGNDGLYPLSALIFDSAGNLYGTTADDYNCEDCDGGVVFRLSPTANGPWTEKILHNFTGGDDGSFAVAGVVFDKAAHLYGTTQFGGGNTACTGGCGVVYRLSSGANGK